MIYEMKLSIAALVLLWLVRISIATTADSVEDITENKQVYTITCDPHATPDCHSTTLETIAAELKAGSEGYVEIYIPRLILNTIVKFDNLHSLTIDGGPNVTSIVCTTDADTDVGIVLTNITGKTGLKNLNISHCGARIKLSTDLWHTYTSALYVSHCNNVDIEGVIIERSRGIGLVIVANKGEKFIARSTIFKYNVPPEENATLDEIDRLRGGGGVFIISVKQTKQNLSYLPLDTTFRFVDCVFEHNDAKTTYYNYAFTDILGEVHDGYGRGGGMRVFISDLSNVNVSLTRCVFERNLAFLGAGMSVKIYSHRVDNMENITIEVTDSVFDGNGCNSEDRYKTAGFGGGAHLTLQSSVQDATKSIIARSGYRIKNVTFSRNCAQVGGGVYYYSTKHVIHEDLGSSSENLLLLEGCCLTKNHAHFGSAFTSISDIRKRLSVGLQVNITFLNCSFVNNSILLNAPSKPLGQRTPGLGTVYISSYDIQFRGYAQFENNFGSALYTVDAVLDFQYCDSSFVNNTGLKGGALVLIGSSTIILGRNVYEFYHNKALYKGGAIYVSLTDTLSIIGSFACFMQYKNDNGTIVSDSHDWSAEVTFTGNKAQDDMSGHAIYATSLHPCQLEILANESKYLLNTSDVFTERGFTFMDNVTQIATDGVFLNSKANTLMEVIPGEKYYHSVTVTDELGQVTNTPFWATIFPSNNTDDVELDPSLITDKIRVRGRPSNSELTLQLHVVSQTESFINLSMRLVACPPGFVFQKDTHECECNPDAYEGIFRCDPEAFQSLLLPGYWAGFMKTQNASNPRELVTGICPFCDINASDYKVILRKNSTELERTICGETRMGVACGKCRENYTVHFHSPSYRCKPAEPDGCRLGWIFYFLSEIVPVTVFFVTVLALNISFTSGAINGFILYGQLLGSLDLGTKRVNKLVDTTVPPISHVRQTYQILYGILDLNFFNSESLSFCLWKDATALDMLAVKYITILYTLLLVVAVIYIMNKCGGRCCGRCCRITAIKTSVVHGISTFLIITYSQCVSVSLSLLLEVHLHSSKDSDFHPQKRVLLNGEIVYMGKEHLPYAIPAIICLLTIGVLPPALLLIYPLINKVVTVLGVDEWRCVTVITGVSSNSNIKPLLDSFQGCFKDNFRFFAGIYFLYRWAVLLVLMGTIDFATYYTAINSTLLSMLVIHAICLPYIKSVHNIIDTLLFGTLIMINSASMLNYQRSTSPKSSYHPNATPAIIQVVFTLLPAATVAIYVLVHLCRSIAKWSSDSLGMIELSAKVRKVYRRLKLKGGLISNAESDEVVHDRLLQHKRLNCYVCTDSDRQQ